MHCVGSCPVNGKTKVVFYRKDLNQLETLEKGICAEIKDAERTISRTEEKCAGITQSIPETVELEKTEQERVIDTVLLVMLKV